MASGAARSSRAVSSEAIMPYGSAMTQSLRTAVVVGAGPAGLMAAETLARAGLGVTVHERMPSAGRKLLMAGRGGLNLTHSEPLEAFVARYGEAAPTIARWLEAFSPGDLRAWAEGLGQPVFVGTSGRVFPRAMKASPLLRAWLARLEDLGVDLRLRSRWTGWDAGALRFETPTGERLETPDAVVLALGGASWPRLGSDGAWTDGLEAPLSPFRAANAGFACGWTPLFRARFAGAPLKAVELAFDGVRVRGEAMVADYGLEGGAVYALSAALREAVARDGSALLRLDLRPDMDRDDLVRRLARNPQGVKLSISNRLRRAGFAPVEIGLLREAAGRELPVGAEALAGLVKALPLRLGAMRGLERAISSAGGVRLEALDAALMLSRRPGVFLAGEMLDWEAPTGGYLLQAAFASGVVAARGALRWLGVGSAA